MENNQLEQLLDSIWNEFNCNIPSWWLKVILNNVLKEIELSSIEEYLEYRKTN
jgi:hypothetical protein